LKNSDVHKSEHYLSFFSPSPPYACPSFLLHSCSSSNYAPELWCLPNRFKAKSIELLMKPTQVCI
jgi:hypothetical protein